MVKNSSPQQMAKSGHSHKKQTPQAKMGKPSPMSAKSSNKQQVHTTPKDQFKTTKTGQTPVHKSASKFATPKQALNFQTPKSTPKFQSPKKGQQSGKKVSTPHPMKKQQPESDEDDEEDFEDEEMDSDDVSDEEEDIPKNGAGHKKQLSAKQANLLAKQSQMVKGQPSKKLPAAAQGKKGKQEMESFDDEDEIDDEELSDLDDEMDESEEEEDATPPVKKLATKGQQLKRPAPEEDEDEEDEDEEDEDEEDEDEEESDEEDEEEDQKPVKGMKGTFPQKGAQQTKAEPASKKLKTNEGVAVEKKGGEKLPKRPTMLTTLDKELQQEVNERKRERNNRSIFFKNMARDVSDEDIKALSPDILFVQRKKPGMPFGWIMFANEQLCKKNFQKLKEAKIGNHTLHLDLCGTNDAMQEHRVDALKLYVGNLPPSTKDEELKRLFPKSTSIFHRFDKTFAIIGFGSPEFARQAFEKNKDAEIKGSKVIVCYAKALEKNQKKPAVPVKNVAKEKTASKA